MQEQGKNELKLQKFQIQINYQKPKINGSSFCKRNEKIDENKKNGKVKLNETIKIF